MRRILPDPQQSLSDDELRVAYGFPAQRPWVRGSMVSTLDGAMRGIDGHSGSISSAADKRVFNILRMTADVILVGAGTVRDEGYRPSRRPIAVVTSRLDLPLSLPLLSERTDQTPTTLVFTTAAAAAGAPPGLAAVAEVVACGRDSVDLGCVVATLAERGLGAIHCEGGPRLLGSLAAAGLLDEVLLTLTPLLLGGPEHIVSVPDGLGVGRMRATQVLEEDGSVFVRARRS